MVYELYRNSAYAFIEIIEGRLSNEGRLPKEVISCLLEGLPIPENYIPKRVVVQADRPMPHLWNYGGSWVVSAKARALFTKLVPNSISFVPITIVGPPEMKLDPKYYYMNVLVRDQLVDYERSKLWKKREALRDGTYDTTVEGSPRSRSIVFKPHAKYHLWREINFQVGDERFSFSSSRVLLSDALWNELNTAFPNEVDPADLAKPMTYNTSR